jgi:hypothetical protein
MKKFSRKSALLFAGVMALCAFAMPSMASAASWGVIGTPHALDGPGLGFVSHTSSGIAGSSCAETQFNTDVTSAAVLTITSTTFKNCSGTGIATGCTVTPVGTRLPWQATGVSTTDVRIDNVHIDVRFETRPPAGGTACALNGINVTLTGTLLGGRWDSAGSQVTYTNATGLIGHSILGSSVATVTGTIRDTPGTLTLS